MRTLIVLFFTYVSAYEYGFYVEEGAFCPKRTGEKGICTHFSKCPSAIEEVKHNGRPEICSFAGIFPIVCCVKDKSHHTDNHEFKPTDNFPYYIPFEERKISLKKCREYYSKVQTKSTGDKQVRSAARRHPHMAVLGVIHRNTVQWKCSGALISEQFVLTAAECINRLKTDFVRLGDFDLKSQQDDYGTQDFRIKKTYFYTNYDVALLLAKTTAKNIALVQLDRPIEFTDYVKPACLGITQNINGTLPETAGWNLDYENSSHQLQTHYLKYISGGVCSHLTDEDTEICAGDGGSCDISYGSPLQIPNFYYEFNSFPEIVGVMNQPESCDERKLPGTYTKIDSCLPWIEKIIWSKS